MCFGEKRRARYGNSSERFGRRVGGGRRDRCAGDGCVATGAGRGADDGVPGAAAAGDAESERERDYASENLKVVDFPTPTLTGNVISGTGTYSYGYSQYPSTTG